MSSALKASVLYIVGKPALLCSPADMHALLFLEVVLLSDRRVLKCFIIMSDLENLASIIQVWSKLPEKAEKPGSYPHGLCISVGEWLCWCIRKRKRHVGLEEGDSSSLVSGFIGKVPWRGKKKKKLKMEWRRVIFFFTSWSRTVAEIKCSVV